MSAMTFDSVLAATLSDVKLLVTEGFQMHPCKLGIEKIHWHRLHPTFVM